jgi:hypothetical protein
MRNFENFNTELANIVLIFGERDCHFKPLNLSTVINVILL